jgi:CBS-domain-containing membrane protein
VNIAEPVNIRQSKQGKIRAMAIGEICNRDVVFVEPDETVVAAAKLMRQHHVGSLVVARDEQGQRTPMGMLTDRDITVSIVAPGLDPDTLLAGDVMSTELIAVREDAGISEAVELMRLKGVRRLPVIDISGKLVGLIASDDLLSLLAEEMAALARMISRESAHENARRKTPAAERVP